MTQSPGQLEVPETFSPSISSRTRVAKRRSQQQAQRVQNAAFLLRIRPELPDVNDQDLEMLNRTHVVKSFYDGVADSQLIEGFSVHPQQPESQELEKVKFRIPLHTMDSSLSVTCVDHLHSESDCRLDIFDRIKARMDVPSTYEHLAWRLSVSRRKDPPHRLLTSYDIDSAFKAVRAEFREGKGRKRVVIEIINTMPALKENPVKRSSRSSVAGKQSLTNETRGQGRALSSLQRMPTEIISPIIHNHIHVSPAISDTVTSEGKQQGECPIMMPQPLKRTYALYMESDEESSDDEPPQIIGNFLTSVHSRYPAMNFLQYAGKLKDRGILYLPTAVRFNVGFYQNKVGNITISESLASVISSDIFLPLLPPVAKLVAFATYKQKPAIDVAKRRPSTVPEVPSMTMPVRGLYSNLIRSLRSLRAKGSEENLMWVMIVLEDKRRSHYCTYES
ncbi:uncharacterized protein F5891DRAFT_1221256 [Suillus fuscotomentosus]|uniref:Uncharacterized protein n=1 Tax=Suillus fuscotomentosus TaxID=1912939 RepID=A0AAD4E8W2_9AGAM|nr:uncharacterized protein F5891DRAFT_1221256 [Suillus fuscotomentosus]KAG1901730.1 hypothetical protein F5891DRAFT_1221256 [Suillus fuscotomentosus]